MVDFLCFFFLQLPSAEQTLFLRFFFYRRCFVGHIGFCFTENLCFRNRDTNSSVPALAPLYIKKAYKDEPSFRDAKVIFSLYEDDFKQPFHADFSNKLLLKGIAKKDIAGLKEPIDYTALCKLAADFSDGIIQQSEHVNEEVLNYARESGKPVLEYQSPENFAEACNDFYDKVWETEQK